MSILNEFERRLGGAIEGLFTKAFRGGLQPVELATRILKEMEANKTVGVHDVWVPNRYVFYLSEPDRERFGQAERSLRRELQQVVREGARERGWGLVGAPEVQIETDPSLKEGDFQCQPLLVEDPSTGQDGAQEQRGDQDAELILLEEGKPSKAFRLSKERVIIGRLAESDIVLEDPGASRRHAEVRRHDGEFVIADLGSTNGTMVNESTVGERALEEGDRITIGRTVLEFRRR